MQKALAIVTHEPRPTFGKEIATGAGVSGTSVCRRRPPAEDDSWEADAVERRRARADYSIRLIANPMKVVPTASYVAI